MKCYLLPRYMYMVYIPHIFGVYMHNLATEGLLRKKPSTSLPIIGMLKTKTLQYMQHHKIKCRRNYFWNLMFWDKPTVAIRPCKYIFRILQHLYICSLNEHMAFIKGKQNLFSTPKSLSHAIWQCQMCKPSLSRQVTTKINSVWLLRNSGIWQGRVRLIPYNRQPALEGGQRGRVPQNVMF